MDGNNLYDENSCKILRNAHKFSTENRSIPTM